MRVLLFILVCIAISCSQEKKSEDTTNDAKSPPVQSKPATKRLINFPRDEGAHYDQPIEWWYLNAQFTDSAGKSYSFFYCKFSRGRHLVSLFDKAANKIWAKDYYESVNASETNLNLSSITGFWKQDDQPFSYKFMYNFEGVVFQMDLKAIKTPFFPGGEGLIRMGENGSSYYYALTDLTLSGSLEKGTNDIPTGVKGRAWMDHQWGRWDWVKDFDRWKWYSVKLDNGVDLMLFNIYKGQTPINSYCGYIDAENKQHHTLQCKLITQESYTDSRNGKWPMKVELQFPELANTALLLESENENQFIEPSVLWEGSMQVQGVFNGKKVTGNAFQELNRPD